ncbi:Cyclic nucleotide-binding domain-containing protein [Cynara cardunculus var. scolymus]|uniref:Cyclic nucleotide-binding domain-containing protein n=1 Tax=Cynara cardunculus var. scolymus TaxID=59895 RepID=A0A103YJC0_CYNCS|nr:Cyclic nucleotide-binding domain-containing protein [Cynara cardunculus var. scolymus]
MTRFQDWKSDNSNGQYSTSNGGSSQRFRSTLGSVSNMFRKSLEHGSGGFKSLKRSMESHSLNRILSRGLGSGKKTLNPQGKFLQKWNKIFVLSCVIAVSVDPLFFYIPIVKDDKKCLDLDKKLQITASVLRSFTDIFYIVHIIFQFHTGFIAPSSRVFGRGVLVEDAWEIAKRYMSSYFLVDILAVLPLPQVFGAFWYLFSIERETTCWRQACGNISATIVDGTTPGCVHSSFYCQDESHPVGYLNSRCPIQESNNTPYDFGIFLPALQSGVVNSTDFPQKFFYCFWWGLQNLSSLGQNLKTSTFVWEICFAVSISIAGLVLFSFLIGNMQTYLQSTTLRLEEMRVKRRDAEQWMSHRLLPDPLKERIRRYEQYKWQETRGVDEDNLIRNLPKDLRRDIKRHLCLQLLRRVPMFEKMDDQLMDALCDRLKPVLYTEDSYIVREGDPVDEMLFVMRGKLLSVTTNGGRTGFFNSDYLRAGDFCGEELLTWALDPHTSSNLPISTRTVQALEEVEAFALMADDLKFVASQFRRLHSKQLRHTFRLYSQQWRTWAACFIQAAWRRHCRKKLEDSLREEEDRLQNALTGGGGSGGSSPSLGATIYASRFAANALRALRRNGARKTRISEKLPPLMLQKPAEPDFTSEDK